MRIFLDGRRAVVVVVGEMVDMKADNGPAQGRGGGRGWREKERARNSSSRIKHSPPSLYRLAPAKPAY